MNKKYLNFRTDMADERVDTYKKVHNLTDVDGIKVTSKSDNSITTTIVDVLNKNATQLTVSVSGELQNFIKVLSGYKVLTMESIPQTLEETFTYLYGGDLSD